MATLGRRRDDQQYGRLIDAMSPTATPTKRIGSESANAAASTGAPDFTKSTASSPGNIFQRQLGTAEIGGVTRLAEQPLLREAGGEALRVAGEAADYRKRMGEQRASQPQFEFKGQKEGQEIDYTPDIVNRISGGGEDFDKARAILTNKPIELPELKIGKIKEFTPQQALQSGSVESILKKEAEGPYSTGMAGLDALLFAKKGGAAQLGTRAQALRVAGQTAADVLEKGVTEEERSKTQSAVEKQKADLLAAIRGGIASKESAYTQAPEGGKSKIEQKKAALGEEYRQKAETVQSKINELVESQKQSLHDQVLENMINKLKSESIASQTSAGREVQGDVAIRVPSRAELIEQAKTDKRYIHALKNLDLQLRQSVPGSQLSAGQIPNVGLENVITAEDADAYNRLQALIGGKSITPAAAQLQAPQLKGEQVTSILDYFNKLKPFAGV